jgi:hypothetical protein
MLIALCLSTERTHDICVDLQASSRNASPCTAGGDDKEKISSYRCSVARLQRYIVQIAALLLSV